jgi:hypothetical protein
MFSFKRYVSLPLARYKSLSEWSKTRSNLEIAKKKDPKDCLKPGVVPITWEPSPDHLIIETEEAKQLFTQIKEGKYPSLGELIENPVISQIDSLSDYYKELYGNTADIETPERKKLRDEVLNKFLSIGSARKTDKGYVYDGPLEKGFQMELVLGLPAAGKSTRASDPDSEKTKSFILDCDVIKEMLPEFIESHGAAADAVHLESMLIMDMAREELVNGKMKGTNLILPLVADDFKTLMSSYIKPFEEAGYNVRARFLTCEVNASMSRNIARELETGRIINSSVVFSFGEKPEEVYNMLAPMINSKGFPYAIENKKE